MAVGDSVDQGDLKKVKGIGPKVEARLKGAGITTLGQLARTPVNELAAILDGLSGKFDADRIIHEDWLSQAATLATVPATGATEAGLVKRVRHNFTIEVRLAVAGRDIVSSKVVHLQTSDEATWAGWDRQRLVAFIEDRAGARPSASAEEAEEAEGEARPATEPVTDTGGGDSVDEPRLALHTFAMVPATGPEVTASGAITATLSFDAAAIALPADQVAQAKVDVYARRPPPGSSILVGSALADLSPGEPVRLQIPCYLSATGHPVGLFAAVQLFVTNVAGRTPSSVLPNAAMTLSTTSAAAPGNPGTAAERHGGALA
jgi:hypothetical protein